MFLGPSGMHQWRQADCYSIAKNYYMEGMQFMEPKIHYQGGMQGHAVSEFPILNYTAACLWNVFGESPFVYRCLNYTIFCVVLLIISWQLYNIFNSIFKSWFVMAFMASAPLLAYYAPNFIADVPAFSFAILAFVLVWRFNLKPNYLLFNAALICSLCAVLLKASNVVPLGILLLQVIWSWKSNNTAVYKWLYIKRRFVLIFLITGILAIACWYRFALQYNQNFANNVFLLTILPIWKMQAADMADNFSALLHQHAPVMLNPLMWLVLLLQLLYCIWHCKRASAFLNLALVCSSLYTLFYILAFFQVFKHHDYYLITLMLWPLIIQVHFWSLVQFNTPRLKWGMALAVLFFLFNALHAAAIVRLRLIKDDKLVSWYPCISKTEKDLAQYLHWDYERHIGSIEKLEPELRRHSITRNETIIAIPDQSFNIALNFLDQKGWTIALDHLQNDSNVVLEVMHRNPKYIVLMDTHLLALPALKRVQQQLQVVFKPGHGAVYKIKPHAL